MTYIEQTYDKDTRFIIIMEKSFSKKMEEEEECYSFIVHY